MDAPLVSSTRPGLLVATHTPLPVRSIASQPTPMERVCPLLSVTTVKLCAVPPEEPPEAPYFCSKAFVSLFTCSVSF